jgi:hypothetical protein
MTEYIGRERKRKRKRKGIKITVPTHGKVQTFQ